MDEDQKLADLREAKRINQENFRRRHKCIQQLLMFLYALIGLNAFPCTEEPKKPQKVSPPPCPRKSANPTANKMNEYRRKLEDYNKKYKEYVTKRDQYDADLAKYQAENEIYMEWMHGKVTSFKEKFEKICENKFQESLNSTSNLTCQTTSTTSLNSLVSSASTSSSSNSLMSPTSTSSQFNQNYNCNDVSSTFNDPSSMHRRNSESSTGSTTNVQFHHPNNVPQHFDPSTLPFDFSSNYSSSNVMNMQTANNNTLQHVQSNNDVYQGFDDGFFEQNNPIVPNGQIYSQPDQYNDVNYPQQQHQNGFYLNQPHQMYSLAQSMSQQSSSHASLRQINDKDSQKNLEQSTATKRSPSNGITPEILGTKGIKWFRC